MTMLAMVPPFTQGDRKMNALARVISLKKLKTDGGPVWRSGGTSNVIDVGLLWHNIQYPKPVWQYQYLKNQISPNISFYPFVWDKWIPRWYIVNNRNNPLFAFMTVFG